MTSLLFPKPLIKGSKVAITAPSSGVHSKFDLRLKAAILNLEKQGLRIVQGQCLHGNKKSASASAEKRAEEFMKFWKDPSIDIIIPPWGGVFVISILPLIKWDYLRETPTWLMGYSDISTLCYAITARTGVATAHGTNLMEMVAGQVDPLTKNCLKPLYSQDSFTQYSSEKYQKSQPYIDERPFTLEHTTEWKTIDQKPSEMQGRIIGGCLDTISSLVSSPWAELEKLFGNDGIIFYLENADLNSTDQFRYLWMMKNSGMFNNVKGWLIGRSSGPEETNPDFYCYNDLIQDFFGSFGVPVIYDVDVGHSPPNLTIINGSKVKVVADGKGSGSLTTYYQ